MIGKACICKVCKKRSLSVNKHSKFGFVDKLKFTCQNENCQSRAKSFTSRRSNLKRNEASKGPTPFALNIRFVFAMRLIGKGKRHSIFLAAQSMFPVVYAKKATKTYRKSLKKSLLLSANKA